MYFGVEVDATLFFGLVAKSSANLNCGHIQSSSAEAFVWEYLLKQFLSSWEIVG